MRQPIPILSESPEVIASIDSEIDYQNNLPSTRQDGKDHGVAGQLVTLERYTRKALDAWTDNPTDEQALNTLRKTAAICVRALILYGCSARLRNGSDGPVEVSHASN